MNIDKKFVIDLGGSVVAPQEIDVAFLKKFYLFLKKEIKRGNQFIIIVGGGGVARRYQNAAASITKVSNKDKDWLGIYATQLNAQLLRIVFKKEATPIVFDKRFKIKNFSRYPVIIGTGWKPGWSTDFVTTQIAIDFNIKQVIILGKPPYVYTADFEKYKKAKPIKKISWEDYLKLIPSEWSPGLRAPVDPIAARLAKKENIKAIVAFGRNLNNLRKILRGEKFKGTILENGAKFTLGH